MSSATAPESVAPGPSGAAARGTGEWLLFGAGFCAAVAAGLWSIELLGISIGGIPKGWLTDFIGISAVGGAALILLLFRRQTRLIQGGSVRTFRDTLK
jgi:hypothetical protein